MPFDHTVQWHRREVPSYIQNDVEPYWLLATWALMLIFGFSPFTIMLTFLLVASWQPIEELTDLIRGPAYSEGGARLTLMGRLTHPWLWTDAPRVVQAEIEQDLREGRY
jgi:hypothetical protein